MRRREMQAVLVAAAVAAAMLVGPVGQAGSEETERIPPCADIVGGGARRAPGGAVTFRLRTAASSCRAFTYTVSIYDGDPNNPAGRAPLATVENPGDGSAADDQGFYNLYFTFPTVQEPADGVFCFTGSSAGGPKEFDVAPDAGTVCVDPDTAGGTQGFR